MATIVSHSPRPNPPKEKAVEKSVIRVAIDLLGCTLGIYVCYIGYGVVQERIYGVDYDGEKFEHSLFLVWMQCLTNGFTALVGVLWQGNLKGITEDKVPKLDYAKIAFSYIGAMYASNWALAFVNYPTQALAKSCKLIPVMLMRVVINGKRYPLSEYVCVVLITLGISIFMLAKQSKGESAANSVFGIFLLFASLALDGYTGPTQENMIAKYKPSIHQLMLNMNVFAVLMVGVALLISGQMFGAVAFVQAHPVVLPQILVFSLLSALGQNFIFITLFRFDSLVLTTVTTTRKFFTILCSVVMFGHVLSAMQWGGVAMVFAGLTLDAYGKYQSKKARMAANPAAKSN